MSNDDHTSESKSYLRPVEPGDPVRRPKKRNFLEQLGLVRSAVLAAITLATLGAGAATNVVGTSWDSNTRAIAANTWTYFSLGTAGTYVAANWPAGFWTSATKSGAVANLYLLANLTYRVIG